MRRQRMPWALPIFLTWLMLGMSLSMCISAPQAAFLGDVKPSNVAVNQPTSLEISSPNGSSSALQAEVPNGHTVESIDVSLSPNALAYNDGFTWSGEPIGMHRVQFSIA